MLAKALESERYTVQTVEQAAGRLTPIANREKVDAVLTTIEQSRPLSAEQREAAIRIATAPSRYLSLQGDAGSGNTTVVGAIRGIAEAEGFSVRAMAVTGNATQALSATSGLQASTVARFLLDERERAKVVRAFDAIDQGEHPRAKELWVVNEASMLNKVDFGRVVHHAEAAKARLVFVGHRRQPNRARPVNAVRRKSCALQCLRPLDSRARQSAQTSAC